jgi:hypothetical protein
MARPSARPTLALLSLVLLAALGFATATSVSGAATGSKRLKCKGGKVLVKINKKQRCQALRKVVPKPKKGDRALINFRNGLVDVTTLKGRRGKRVKLPRRVAAGARVARKRFLRAIPKVIALMERQSKSGAGRHARARGSAVNCGGPGSAQPNGPPGSTDGLGLQGLQGPHGEVGGVLTVEIDGLRHQTTFIKCGSNFYYVSGCPKSNGEAPTQAKGRYTVTQRILRGNTLIHSSSTDATYEDKLLGKVEDTAKLKYFDFTRKEQSLTVASGGVVTGGTADRTVRVNMPSGSYDGRYTRVTINADPNTFKMQDLAASIEEAIQEYKWAENGGSFLHTYGWATFDRPEGTYCAKAIFGPASEAITLQKNQAATVAIHAQGEDGGTATGARWTLIDTTNALFSPTSVTNPSPAINYTVSGSPVGDRVRMTAKFTSTAGVGKDKWTEPIKDLPTVNHIEGTFSGTYKMPIQALGGDSVITWTGTARFDRSSPAIYGGASGVYFLGAGGYTLEASGYDGSGVTGCRQSGTKHIDFTPMSSGSFTVNGVDLVSYFNPPYNYGIQLAGVGPQTFMVTLHDCPQGAQTMEGQQVPVIYFPPAIDTGDAVLVSDDGTRYQGERHQNALGVTTDQYWEFDGRE